MKHRNKQLPTRKRRALRRVALLAALAAVLSVFRLYAFLPIQALRMVEEDHNTGPTGVIRRQLCPAPTVRDWGPQLMYLSSRDDTVLLTGLDFSLLRGWREDFLTLPYDCGEGGPLRRGHGERLQPRRTLGLRLSADR